MHSGSRLKEEIWKVNVDEFCACLVFFEHGQEVPVCIGTFPLAMHDCKISKYEAYATAKIYK
jgi:hypothetical protein